MTNLVVHTNDLSREAALSITESQLPKTKALVLAAYAYSAKKGSFICDLTLDHVFNHYTAICKKFGYKAQSKRTFQRHRDDLCDAGYLTSVTDQFIINGTFKRTTIVTVSVKKFAENFKRAYRKAMTATKHRIAAFFKSDDDAKKQKAVDKCVSLDMATPQSKKPRQKNGACSSSYKPKQIKKKIYFVPNLVEKKAKLFNCTATVDEVKKVAKLYKEKGWVWTFNQYCTRTGKLLRYYGNALKEHKSTFVDLEEQSRLQKIKEQREMAIGAFNMGGLYE